jgi:hypothetical protein
MSWVRRPEILVLLFLIIPFSYRCVCISCEYLYSMQLEVSKTRKERIDHRPSVAAEISLCGVLVMRLHQGDSGAVAPKTGEFRRAWTCPFSTCKVKPLAASAVSHSYILRIFLISNESSKHATRPHTKIS